MINNGNSVGFIFKVVGIVWGTVYGAKCINKINIYHKIAISTCNCQMVQTVWK